MKNWKKANRTKMMVYYTLDKYREAKNFLDTIETVEGYQAYLNTPMAQSFINIETMDGKHVSISRELILKVEYEELPNWTLVNEPRIVDAAELRLKSLDNDIEIQKTQFDQEKRLRETLDQATG